MQLLRCGEGYVEPGARPPAVQPHVSPECLHSVAEAAEPRLTHTLGVKPTAVIHDDDPQAGAAATDGDAGLCCTRVFEDVGEALRDDEVGRAFYLWGVARLANRRVGI